jgi:prepilin-type N-terminal cleavage/methylation domain-containing protein
MKFKNLKSGPARTFFRGGFTLLEILLVVGIISLLAGIVIVAINPGKQLASVRNTQRKSDLKQLNSAITQYYIGEQEYPADVQSATTYTEICDTGNVPGPQETIVCGSLADLSVLVPTYITAIPVDPQGASTTAFINTAYAAEGGTGYYVMKDSHQKLILNTERAELGTVIAIGTTTAMVGGGEGGEETTSTLGNGLLVHYKMNDTNGTTVVDTKGHNASGNYTHSDGWVGSGAIDFSGGDNIDFSGPALIRGSGARTVLAWVKVPSNSGTNAVLNYGDWTANGGSGGAWAFSIRQDSYGPIALETGALDTYSGPSGGLSEVSTDSVFDEGWHLVGASFDGEQTVKLWIDGVSVTENSNAPLNTGVDDMYGAFIGNWLENGWTSDFTIDDFRIYNRVLLIDEWDALYNNGVGTEAE